MFASRLDLIMVVTMLPVWISCGVQASTTTTIQTRRLRGNSVTHKRTLTEYRNKEMSARDMSHQSLLDARPQHTTTMRANEQEINYVDTEIIDEQTISPEEAIHQKARRNDKSLHALPSGTLDREFNATLYQELHNAPFEIYESAFDVGKEEREDSFPIFIVPDWNKDATGVFSGFSRTATPLTFQNMQFLLSWNDIVEASTGAQEELNNFMYRNNFEASLFIGKTLGDAVSNVPFLGLVVSYKQSSQKNILIPFAKLENFFHGTSEKHLLSESIHHLEYDALQEMLDKERASNSTNSFFHPEIVADTRNNNRKEQLEDIEALHFRRLFQLLIRRTFLFSFGYADCLKEEPHTLRSCLDDTFSLVVQMEAAVRDAMDDQLIEELAKVTKLANAPKIREACISVSPGTYGMNECSLSTPGSFRGLGGGVPLSTRATSKFR
jgi:hypothetical protein